MTKKLRISAAPIALACAVLATVTAGCSRGGGQSAATAAVTAATAPPLAALPLTTGDTEPVILAPALAGMPSAPPARVTRVADPRQRYAYLDRAYAAAQAYGDAPPDYAYDYDGVRPWVWRGDDGSQRVAERTAEGLRYYYYEPGARSPYLVQDGGYTYGYSDGQLASVYRDGALLSYAEAQQRADTAGRYLARASALFAASVRQQRLGVAQAHWEAERAEVAANQARWAQEQHQYADWETFHQAHVQQYHDHYAGEQYRRDAEAVRYAQSINDQPAAAQALQAAQQDAGVAHRAGQDVGPLPTPNFASRPVQPPPGGQAGRQDPDLRRPDQAGPNRVGPDHLGSNRQDRMPDGPDRFDPRAASGAIEPQPHAMSPGRTNASLQAAHQAEQHARAQAVQAHTQQAAEAKAQREAAQQDQVRAQISAQQQAQATRVAHAQAAADMRAAHEAAGRADAAAHQAQQAASRQAQQQTIAVREAAQQAQAQARLAAHEAKPGPNAPPPGHAEPPHPPAPARAKPENDRRPQP